MLLWWALVWLAAGCTLNPSHTPERAAELVIEICRGKFQLQDVQAQVIGQTLYTRAQMPGFLRRLVESGNFSRQDSDRIGDLLMTTTQVSLSAHPPIAFYVLRLDDPDAPGTELRYVTYLDDIRRLYANALSESEFFDRRIQELKVNPSDAVMSDAWMEREVTLGEFLSVQLALRLKALALQDSSLADWDVEDCVGWYRDGALSLAVARTPPVEGAEVSPMPWPASALELIARVVQEYRFDDYDRVILTDASTHETRELTKAELEAHHKQR